MRLPAFNSRHALAVIVAAVVIAILAWLLLAGEQSQAPTGPDSYRLWPEAVIALAAQAVLAPQV